jgi:hypothetical protein
MKWVKYLAPFFISVFVFGSMGFSPAECLNMDKSKLCKIPLSPHDNEIDFENCSYKDFPLYGKIKFVEDFPDITVKVVEQFPDLKVKLVSHFPDDCGKWKIVEDFPDLKVKIVNDFPDIKIKFVENFEGKP